MHLRKKSPPAIRSLAARSGLTDLYEKLILLAQIVLLCSEID
jgi:hypothetical protein